MKLKIILFSLFISTFSFSQYPPDSTLTNPFGALDTSSAITSGILLNKIYSQEPRPGLNSDSIFYPQNMIQAYSEYKSTLQGFRTLEGLNVNRSAKEVVRL